MPKLDELVRAEGNRYSNSRNVPSMETLDSELNNLVSYCNKLNNYAAAIEEEGAEIQPGDNNKLMVSADDQLKWQKLTDDYVDSISGNKIINSTLPLSKLSGISKDKVLVSDNSNNLLCSLITSKYLDDSAVTSAKLAANSVITDKINNAAVTTDKIADNAVTADKIADNAVTADKIADEVAAKIERILNLPKIELLPCHPNTKYYLDQNYRTHIIILPVLDGYNIEYAVAVYKNMEAPKTYNFSTIITGQFKPRGRGGTFIFENTQNDVYAIAHSYPYQFSFVDIKMGKVYPGE